MSAKSTSTSLRAFRWSAASSGVKILTSLVVPIVLARLLAPEIFGLVAMATVFTGIGQLLADFGTGDAIIQREKVEPELLHSIVWFNLVIGIGLYLFLWALSKQIAWFFEEPLVEDIVTIQALVVIVQSFTVVPVALLKKRFDFYSLTIATTVASVGSSIVAIAMAALDYGVWSLIAFAVVNALAYAGAVWFRAGYFPKLYLSPARIKGILSFSAYLTGARFLNYLERQSDKLVVGYVLGSQQLGFYSRGYAFLVRPIKSICGFVNPVVYAGMAKNQKNQEKLQSLYLSTTQALSMVFFPSAVTLMLFSEPIVLNVLGEAWMGLEPLLPVFAVVLLYKPLYKIMPEIFKALGRTKTIFRLRVIYTPFFLLGFIIGAQYGIYEVALSYAVVCFILFVHSTLVITKAINLPLTRVIKVLRNVLLRTLILTAFLGSCAWYADKNGYEFGLVALAVLILAGMILFAGLHVILPFKAFEQLLEFLSLDKFLSARLRRAD